MLVLLDLLLPEMDGVEFRAMQRAIPSIADVPVVVLTGQRSLVKAAEQLNVTHVLNKPVDPGRLLETIKELSTPLLAAG
jgi:CheY-like chemotaxis protein